jgi:hypothetical protein
MYRSNGQKTPIVTVTTTDGRTAAGRTEVVIAGIYYMGGSRRTVVAGDGFAMAALLESPCNYPTNLA